MTKNTLSRNIRRMFSIFLASMFVLLLLPGNISAATTTSSLYLAAPQNATRIITVPMNYGLVSNPTWITVAKTSSTTYRFSISYNYSSNNRSGEVVFKNGANYHKVNVTQEGFYIRIKTSSDKPISINGGSVRFYVESNSSWGVSVQNGATATLTSGEGNQSFVVNVSSNYGKPLFFGSGASRTILVTVFNYVATSVNLVQYGNCAATKYAPDGSILYKGKTYKISAGSSGMYYDAPGTTYETVTFSKTLFDFWGFITDYSKTSSSSSNAINILGMSASALNAFNNNADNIELEFKFKSSGYVVISAYSTQVQQKYIDLVNRSPIILNSEKDSNEVREILRNNGYTIPSSTRCSRLLHIDPVHAKTRLFGFISVDVNGKLVLTPYVAPMDRHEIGTGFQINGWDSFQRKMNLFLDEPCSVPDSFNELFNRIIQ